jgi:hypothetical protein
VPRYRGWKSLLWSNMYFYITPMRNTDLLESVDENFDVNLLIKRFPADKQFTIWWLNLEKRDS